MKKKSFLEKMGLVERVDQLDTPSYEHYEGGVVVDFDEPEIEVNTAENVTENLIGDIYASNNLDDMSRSIFKAEEVSKSLPDTMPTDTKRMAVIGILSSFNLTVPEMLGDAGARRDVVVAATSAMMKDCTDTIESIKEHIEDLRKQIAGCEADIKANEEKYAFIRQSYECEVKRIDALVDFLADGETKGKENA